MSSIGSVSGAPSRKIKKGFLYKKGHVVKNWKLRYFVLEVGAEYMHYYKDDKEENLKRPLGSVPLYEAKLSTNLIVPDKRPYLFEVSTVVGKTWLLSAEKEEEKASWIDTLKQAIEACPFTLDVLYHDSEARNKAINKMLKDSRRQFDREIKLLLLGAGDAGKSTFVKQMKLIHLNGYTKEELQETKPLVLQNILLCLKALLYGLEKLHLEVEESHQEIASFYSKLQVLTEDILVSKLKETKELWQDKGVQLAFSKSHEFQLPASCTYWMENLAKIGTVGYVPNPQDILRCRVVTTGIAETFFEVDSVPFRVVDVGGQRSERKKWIHCFQDVTAVVFLVAVNEYDLKLVEDETVNRMHESVQLFENISNDKYLTNVPMIVFLNKSDLFKEKIAKVDLNICFPEYQGGCNYENGIKFLEDKVIKLNRNSDRPVYVHVTCATDTENIRFVFAAVKSILLQRILDDSDF